VNVKLPPASVIVVPRDVEPSNTSTVEFGSAVPEIVGIGFVVEELFVGTVITGAAGGIVSTIIFIAGVEAGLVLPAGSVAVAVIG
jgi:hypothetical protein